MAILFHYRTKPELNIFPVKEILHEALRGSPAYVNSEIAICDGDSQNEFYLVVGNPQEDIKKDVKINIFLDAVPENGEITEGEEVASGSVEVQLDAEETEEVE